LHDHSDDDDGFSPAASAQDASDAADCLGDASFSEPDDRRGDHRSANFNDHSANFNDHSGPAAARPAAASVAEGFLQPAKRGRHASAEAPFASGYEA
jgi:hypothetical protein